MDNSNIKVYLGISFALIVLFILILVIPFSKKQPVTSRQQPVTNLIPTSVETNPSTNSGQANQSPTLVPTVFTGVKEETLPKELVDLSTQKQALRQKTPLSLSTFTIGFDYNTDKFVVTLLDPKDQARKEFESWRKTNYPVLGSEQFITK